VQYAAMVEFYDEENMERSSLAFAEMSSKSNGQVCIGHGAGDGKGRQLVLVFIQPFDDDAESLGV
jgi:hypothetical protein